MKGASRSRRNLNHKPRDWSVSLHFPSLLRSRSPGFWCVLRVSLQVALQGCWMAGLAGKLGDVMSALGGQSVASNEEDVFEAGDYGYRYLVRTKRSGTRAQRTIKTIVYLFFGPKVGNHVASLCCKPVGSYSPTTATKLW